MAGTSHAPEGCSTRPQLTISPASIEVLVGDACPFTVHTDNPVEWSVKPEVGSIDPHGIYLAPVRLNGSRSIVVLAKESGGRYATATVALSDTPQRIEWLGWFSVVVAALIGAGVLVFWKGPATLLAFVMVMGALGSMLHFASSFADYVGNRTFKASWFWYYVSRPFVGGGLAVIFYFLCGTGWVVPANPSGVMTVGTVSALVGLFSDKAMRKLSDILDVVLAAKDERKDKVS
jgi:hypothetical protein